MWFGDYLAQWSRSLWTWHMHQGPYRDQKISLSLSFITALVLSLLCALVSSDPFVFCLREKQKIFVSKRSHYLLYLINQERICISEMSSIKPWTFLLSWLQSANRHCKPKAACTLCSAACWLCVSNSGLKSTSTQWKSLHDRQVQDKLQPFKEDKRGN